MPHPLGEAVTLPFDTSSKNGLMTSSTRIRQKLLSGYA